MDVDESTFLSREDLVMSLSRERKKVVGPWLERSPVIDGGSPTENLRGLESTLSRPIPGLMMQHWKGIKESVKRETVNDYDK